MPVTEDSLRRLLREAADHATPSPTQLYLVAHRLIDPGRRSRRRPKRLVFAGTGVGLAAAGAAVAVAVVAAGSAGREEVSPSRLGSFASSKASPSTSASPASAAVTSTFCVGRKSGTRQASPALGDGLRWLPPATASSPVVRSAGLSIACPPPLDSNVTLDQALWLTYGPGRLTVASAVSIEAAPTLTPQQEAAGETIVNQWVGDPEFPLGGGTARYALVQGEAGVARLDWFDRGGAEHWVTSSGLSKTQLLDFLDEVSDRPGGYADSAAVPGWTRVTDDPVGHDDGRKWMATLANGIEIEASTGVVGTGFGTGIGSAAQFSPGSVRLPEVNGRNAVMITGADGSAQVTWTTAQGVHVLVFAPSSYGSTSALLALARSLGDASADDPRIFTPR